MSAPSMNATISKSSEDVHPFDVSWRERVVVLGSLSLFLLIAFLLGQEYAPAKIVELYAVVPMAFIVAGKFIPLWGISGQNNLGPYELGVVIWVLDTITVLVFVYSFEAFYKIAPIKRALDRLYAKMKLVLRAYPIMRRASTIGVVLFVLFPVSGTGALGASVIGLLLGMHRAVLIAAVSTGGLIGGFSMAFLAANFASAMLSFQAVQDNPSSRYWILGGLVLLIAIAIYALNRAFQRALVNGHAANESTDTIGQ